MLREGFRAVSQGLSNRRNVAPYTLRAKRVVASREQRSLVLSIFLLRSSLIQDEMSLRFVLR